jgi:hypothetical protein
MVYPSRAHGDRFEVRTARGWEPFYVKGVNLGAATPGHHPSEFPDSGHLRPLDRADGRDGRQHRAPLHHPSPALLTAPWRRGTARTRPRRSGSSTACGPSSRRTTTSPRGVGRAVLRRDAPRGDLLHGRLDQPPRPGHSAGQYTADVRPGARLHHRARVGAILGRETSTRSGRARRSGTAATSPARAARRWTRGWGRRARRSCLRGAARTADAPRRLHQLADARPAAHPTETTVDEEIAIRTRLGERVDRKPLEYDNDRVDLDAALVKPTAAYPRGTSPASTPIRTIPDFMVLRPGLRAAASSSGPSAYFGYLRDLKAHHPGCRSSSASTAFPRRSGARTCSRRGGTTAATRTRRWRRPTPGSTRDIAEAGMAAEGRSSPGSTSGSRRTGS